MKCPESIEELEEWERLVPLCKIELYNQAKAKIESGSAKSVSEASRQIGEEIGKNPEAIRLAINREQREQTVSLTQLAGTDKHRPEIKKVEQSILNTAKAIRQERRELSQEIKREAREIPLPSGIYNIILADPPWQYDFSETTSREIENQYPTLPLEKIKEMQVNSICADDSVLFLWATSPKLLEAMEVITAWGFIYITCAVWDKQKIGMGYYFRQQHELLLVCKKGNLPTPDPSSRVSSVIVSPREKHSKKPDKVYEIIETMYPNEKKIELFSRTERAGWSSWGNEIS